MNNKPNHKVMLEAENIVLGKRIHYIESLTLRELKEAQSLADLMMDLEDDGVDFKL